MVNEIGGHSERPQNPRKITWDFNREFGRVLPGTPKHRALEDLIFTYRLKELQKEKGKADVEESDLDALREFIPVPSTQTTSIDDLLQKKKEEVEKRAVTDPAYRNEYAALVIRVKRFEDEAKRDPAIKLRPLEFTLSHLIVANTLVNRNRFGKKS